MKRLLFPLLMISPLLFIQCGDDEPGEEEVDHLAPLVGSWMMTSITNSGCTNADENGTFDANNSYSILVTITADGTYTVTQCGVVDETGTVSDVTADSFLFCETGVTDCTPDTYVLSGNTITVTTTDDESPGCTVALTLTKDLNPADILAPLVGTWSLTAISASSCDNPDDNGSDECTADCPTLTISADCTYSFVFPDDMGGSETETGSVIATSSHILICENNADQECEFDDDALTYVIDGSALTVTATDDSDFPGCTVVYSLEKQ